jgi:hypothetical protein
MNPEREGELCFFFHFWKTLTIRNVFVIGQTGSPKKFYTLVTSKGKKGGLKKNHGIYGNSGDNQMI